MLLFSLLLGVVGNYLPLGEMHLFSDMKWILDGQQRNT